MKKLSGTDRYMNSDAVAKLFGQTYLASRVTFSDAFPKVTADPKDKLVMGERTHVKIDRKKGSAAGGALFNPETVENAVFGAEITLVNFAVWQLQLLGYIIADLFDGYLRIGSAVTRGYGRVKPENIRVALRSYEKRELEKNTVYGYDHKDIATFEPLSRKGETVVSNLDYSTDLYYRTAAYSGVAWLKNLKVKDNGSITDNIASY